jgi:hypothetical protein
MKKQTLLLAILLAAGFTSGRAQDTWTQKADFGGTARSAAVGFSIGSKGYIGTGCCYFKDFWEYDPATNTWTQKADFGGTARGPAVGFSIGSRGYIGTGYDGSYRKDFWEYDPATNTWTQKADFGGTARSGAVGFSIGSKGYIGTGDDGGFVFQKDFWEYDSATNVWTQKADFGGTERSAAVGFSIGRKGYIGTGTPFCITTKDFWEYDPATNAWTQKADLGGSERSSAVGFSIDSKGYIGTGQDCVSDGQRDFWEYDPVTNAWTQKADFGGTGRFEAVGFSTGSKGYIGTGVDSPVNSTYFKDFWEYDPRPTPTPPQCDTGLIQNGGFETGDLTGWVIDGHTNDPVATNVEAHTGTFSALAGENPQAGNFCEELSEEPLGDSSFYQEFTVPAGTSTLSFWHWNCTFDSIAFDWQDAYITDTNGNILQTIFHQCLNGQIWILQTVDTTPYAGQTVRIKFLVHQDGFNPPGDVTGMYVDDVQVTVPCGSPTPTPTATPGPIQLRGQKKKMNGMNTVRLNWKGATSLSIDVYRDDVLIATTPNAPPFLYTDFTGDTGRTQYTYRVCEAGTATCSNDLRVRFQE